MSLPRSIRSAGPSVLASLVALALLAPGADGQGAGWPRQFDSTSGTLIVFQPQPEKLEGSMVTARAAFSLQKPGASTPTFGVLWFQARVQADRDSNTVNESDLDVTLVRLPGASEQDARRYEHLVEAEATGWDLSGSYSELQSGLAASAHERLSVENLDHTPPRVLFSTKRAILVVYDGPAQLDSIPGSRLQRVVNTPCAVVFDPQKGVYYLNGANLWYTAEDPLGPWDLAGDPPVEVVASVPADTAATDQVTGPPPVVITSTSPAELIVTDGEPMLEPLVGNQLFYVVNTENDVLRDARSGTVYALLSGRWFSAKGLDDPWVYVPSDQLPEVFRQIPPNSPRGYLLASVAGTEAADDAVADDQIPQTGWIARTDSSATVDWDGPPQFEPTGVADMKYGVNTDAQILMADGRFYLCDQGVWYYADTPDGPWFVSDVRPTGLDELPPSCPVYNLRYVEIYDAQPDMVEVGYLPGYLGFYPCRGTVVYGTGYRYRSWHGHRRYFPRPFTYGFGARYNPWLTRWSFGLSYQSGFLRVGLRWHSGFGRGRRHAPPWMGPGGYHRPLFAGDRTLLRLRPRPPLAADVTPTNLYTRPPNVGRLVPAGARAPRRPIVGAGRKLPMPDNVYAGQDGRVYERGSDGQWKVNQGRIWVPAPMPIAPVAPVVPSGGSPNAPGMRGGGRQPGVQPPVSPVAPVTPLPGSGPQPPSPPAGLGNRLPGAQPSPQPVAAPVAPVQPEIPAPTPILRPASPAPAAPSPPAARPAARPIERPVPGNSPGALERQFRARERTSAPPPAVVPHPAPAAPAPHVAPAAPAPAPQRPAKPAEKPAEKKKDEAPRKEK